MLECSWFYFESRFKRYKLICELEGNEVIRHRIVGGQADAKIWKDVLGSAEMDLEKLLVYIKGKQTSPKESDHEMGAFHDSIPNNPQQESNPTPNAAPRPYPAEDKQKEAKTNPQKVNPNSKLILSLEPGSDIDDPEQNEQPSTRKRKSRAPDSDDIAKRKRDNLAERKQGYKAKVRAKENHGAGKRRLGTPDSCNEEKARQKRERLNLNMRICRLNAKLRAEKVKDSIIHMRKERKNIEERIKPLLHSMVYLKDTLFSHTGSNHEINFLSEQTSYIVEVNKPAPIIDTPHDVPRIEIKREKGKQYSKDELEKLRRNKAQKVRNYKKKVSRENDQLELEKLQLQLQTLPLEEQQMKVAKKTIRAESARIINGSLTKEAWEEFIERTFAHVKNCSLNASCNLSVKWPLDPRICEYVGVSYPEDLQSEVQVSSLSGQ